MTEWPRVPLKHLVGINKQTLPETTDPDLEFRYVDIGTVGRGKLLRRPALLTFATAPSRARRLVRPGETIVATVRTYLRAIWPVEEPTADLVVSTGFAVLTPERGLEPRFLGWLAQSNLVVEEIVARSVGVSYPAINPDQIGEIRVGLPPRPLQTAIADFLDAKTARIDALIVRKLALWRLLAYRATAVASRWASDLVEAHGDVQVRRLVGPIEQGWSPVCDNVPAEPDAWGVLKTSAVSSGKFVASENKRLPDTVEPDLRCVVQDGDVLMTRGSGSLGAVGRAVIARTQGRRLMISDLIYRLRLCGTDPEFLVAALGTEAVRQQIGASIRSDSGLTLKLRSDDILSLRIPSVPFPAQLEAAEDLRRRTVFLDRGSDLLSRQISLLQEHRQALVTAAVSGDLGVGEAGRQRPTERVTV